MRKGRKSRFFKTEVDAPPPLEVSISKRVAYNEVDAMAVVWHGCYAQYFEKASNELRWKCGMTYRAFHEANLQAPVIRFHVEYHLPPYLDELITIKAEMIWTEATRINTEYTILKEDGKVATRAYTVQLFVDSVTGDPCIVSPPLLERCRKRWLEMVR